MKLRAPILANYASQIYMTLINLLAVPLYQRHMGAEAYGLVGFFSMLFTLFFLLDFGLSLLVQRETTRFQAGAMSGLEFRQLFRAIGLIFWLLGGLGVFALIFSSEWLAGHWLQSEKLDSSAVQWCLQLMAVTVGLRWLCGLYRGVISGSEHMVWISAFNAVVGTFRFLGVLVCMWWWGFTIEVFFIFQLCVALFEVLGLAFKAYALLPSQSPDGWSLAPLSALVHLGLVGALASVFNVLYVQMDRLLLSGLIPLSDYGNYSLVVLVSTSVMVVSTPISTVILPRMSRLFAEGKIAELEAVYRLGTRLTSSIAGGGALALAFCAEPVLMAWTGDAELAARYWPVLACYALGYAMLALAYFPYYLEAARGSLQLFLCGGAVLLVIQVPAVWVAAHMAGSLGVGWVWAGLAAFYLLVWGGVVHRRLTPGQHFRWLVMDILWMNWPALAGMLLVTSLTLTPQGQGSSALYTIVVGAFLLLANGAWLGWTERSSWRGNWAA